MARIPVRFKRVAMAFDEVAAKVRPRESSGSEHSPPAESSLTDLSDLVNLFIERYGGEDDGVEEEHGGVIKREKRIKSGDVSLDDLWSDTETKKDELHGLFVEDDMKKKIRVEVELALKVTGNDCSKRQLMSRLREQGLDAGLCKSKWERTGRTPAGEFEYIDINISGTRYIIEVCLAGEFSIARPTSSYTSLLDMFPAIFVGKLEELKQIVRLMCAAIKESMKSMDMHVGPWRSNGYMQIKWFGSYKRTTNAISSKNDSNNQNNGAQNRTMGFEASTPIVYYWRDPFARNGRLKLKGGGYLAAAFLTQG